MDATEDGLKEIILAAIEGDWAELCASPQKVAERAATALLPYVTGSRPEDEIRGAPWATR